MHSCRVGSVQRKVCKTTSFSEAFPAHGRGSQTFLTPLTAPGASQPAHQLAVLCSVLYNPAKQAGTAAGRGGHSRVPSSAGQETRLVARPGTSQPRRSNTCHGQKPPRAPSHDRKAPPQIPGDPGDGETEARREAAQPGQERGRLTSPGSALGGEEEQEAPEKEGEGTRPGKHRSPVLGALGLRSRCPGVRCPMSR